jgi:hypothetical protein
VATKKTTNRLLIFILSCATFLGLIYAARGIFMGVSLGRPIDWTRQVGFEFLFWYVWAAFTPPVLWFAQRFELNRSHWLRTVLALIAFGLLIAPLQSATEYSLAYSIDWLRHVPEVEMQRRRAILGRAIIVEAFGNFIIYALIICGHYAYEYYQRYREREIRAVDLEGRLAQAELQNLKMQLHPHFLFNTLHTISVLMMRDVNTANQTLIRLSDLLRTTLDSAGTQLVPLKQELDFLRGYLEIEKTRFQDRLTIEFDVPANVLDVLVPNLILQPLVENAIIHGIAVRPGVGTIQISARRQGDHLELTISDNGSGLTRVDPISIKKGIGLTNTEARLRQLYGETQSFELSRAEGGGLTVKVSIPLKTNESQRSED